MSVRHWHILTWLAGRRGRPVIGLTSGTGVPSDWAEVNGAYARTVDDPEGGDRHVIGHYRCDDPNHGQR